MSTRLKLIILVIFTSLAGTSSLFIYNLMMQPVRDIESEQKNLENLSYTLIDYIAQVNRLDSEVFNEQTALVMQKQKELNNKINQIKELEVLPSINNSTAESIENIIRLSDKIKMSQSTLEARIDKVNNTVSDVLGEDQDYILTQLVWELESDKETTSQIQKEFSFLTSSVSTLNENMNSTLSQIEDQYNIIIEESGNYKRRAQYIIWIIILIVFSVPLVIALLTANVIANRVKRIEIGISAMKEGDLSERINVNSRDEMGRLSNNVNDFTDKLSLSIRKIKETSKTNIQLKNRLVSSVQMVSETTNNVNDSILSISSNMKNLDKNVQTTGNVVTTMENHLTTLDTIIQEQISMIEEASAAITEMITSIASVKEITQRKKEALTNLVQVSRDGGTKLEETNKKIGRIHSNLSEIEKTATIIEEIAGSTNLLAMNAAIEAAHAGSAGKGFAVVSNEIGKLAEATSENSKVISKIMKGITENINDAVVAGTETQKAFVSIDKEVLETSNSFDEIATNMGELHTGGTQIHDSMTRLNDISIQVNDVKTAIRDESAENKKSMENVEQISGTTTQKVQDITLALSELLKEMEAVTKVTQQAGEISRTLEEETAIFTIDEKIQPV